MPSFPSALVGNLVQVAFLDSRRRRSGMTAWLCCFTLLSSRQQAGTPVLLKWQVFSATARIVDRHRISEILLHNRGGSCPYGLQIFRPYGRSGQPAMFGMHEFRM